MKLAKSGDKVRIDYSGRLEDGTVFDSTLESTECSIEDCDTAEQDSGDCGCSCDVGPVDLTVGAKQLFPQIDEALVGMAPGEKKTITILAEDAFGEYDEEKVFTVPHGNLPDDLAPAVGDELVLTNEDDEDLGVLVVEVNEEGVTFDANHPLAGHDLTYDIQLVEIL